jgi:hypothetical protein
MPMIRSGRCDECRRRKRKVCAAPMACGLALLTPRSAMKGDPPAPVARTDKYHAGTATRSPNLSTCRTPVRTTPATNIRPPSLLAGALKAMVRTSYLASGLRKIHLAGKESTTLSNHLSWIPSHAMRNERGKRPVECPPSHLRHATTRPGYRLNLLGCCMLLLPQG